MTQQSSALRWIIPIVTMILVLSSCSGDPLGVTPRQPPTAAAGGPYTGQEGTAITFDASGSTGSGALSFDWSFGDGSTGTGLQPVHTYQDDGTYTVVLTVTGPQGLVSAPNTAIATVENVPPSVNISLAADSVPVADSVEATGSFTDPGLLDAPWAWELDWGDGTMETGSTSTPSGHISLSRAYESAGTYTIRLRVTDKDGATGEAEATVVVVAVPEPDAPIRLVTYGDSNTDGGWDGTDPELLVRSYISRAPLRLGPSDPHDRRQLAGKIEALWHEVRTDPITVVNHGIGGTTTGGGGFGGSNRHSSGAPNSRTRVDGVTRYEAEVLGRGAPDWHGGEPVNASYPDGPVTRVNAFLPGPNDFAYVSMGTNDPASGIPAAQTIQNLEWMIDGWIDEKRPASHFLLTTLPPREPRFVAEFPTLNEAIRSLSADKGVHLIDLAAYTSDDDGLTWREEDLHVGDLVHYSEAVRDWLAAQVVSHMRAMVPGQLAGN
jgi:PKD repeat protein